MDERKLRLVTGGGKKQPQPERRGNGILPIDDLLTDRPYLDAINSLNKAPQGKDQKPHLEVLDGGSPEAKLDQLVTEHPIGSLLELRSSPPTSATVFGHMLFEHHGQKVPVVVIKDSRGKKAYAYGDGNLVAWGMEWEG